MSIFGLLKLYIILKAKHKYFNLFQMMAHNTTVQLGGTAFLVCKVAGVDRVGVNWVCFGVLCIFLFLYNKLSRIKYKLESFFAHHLSA